MSLQAPDRETILETVRSWTSEDRIELVQAILQLELHKKSAPAHNFLALAGIARIPGETQPTAEEEQQWLDERRELRG
jgi:hypothetical protein